MNGAEEKPIIWIIDENIYELRTHYNIFKRMMPVTIEVKSVEAYQHLDDYLAIIGNPSTVCIITDQKLKVRGTADYTGIELAEFVRGINPKLPVYILTNYARDRDEFVGGEWTVEDIISKESLRYDDDKKILQARIIRRINIYEDILSSRGERMRLLLMKDMEGKLQNIEEEELKQLRLQKTSASLVRELANIAQMEQMIRAHEEFRNNIRNLNRKGN